jgi:hypothetical protein
VPFVTTYHPALSNLSSIVREHWTTIPKRGEMSALTKMSFKLLGFLKAKTGGSLNILHSSGCFGMVVQCSRTMLDELCKIFKEPPVLAFRKPKSLKDILVRADISPRSAYNGQCQKWFAICIASVAIQAFTKLLFSFSDVLKTTNCTFQEVDNIVCLEVGIAVYDELFSCMCAAEWMIKADRKGKASGLENLTPYHRMESMRKSNILS